MSLSDDLGALKSADVRSCRVYGATIEHPEEADTIWDACTSPARSAAAVAHILTRHGITVSATTVKRHRLGQCSCRRMVPERFDERPV